MLHESAIKPWQHEHWLFPKDPQFAEKAGPILDLYAGMWEGKSLGRTDYVLSMDEKTSIQARGRRHEETPPQPKRKRTLLPAPRRAEDRARSSRPPCHPRSAWRPATGSDCRAVPDRGVGGLHAFGPAIARRRWRASFWRAALRRDSSRRCWRICSGWFAAQRSGSKGSRSVAPALKCSSTSRR